MPPRDGRARGTIPRFTETELQALRILLNGLHDKAWLHTDSMMLSFLPDGAAAALRRVQRRLDNRGARDCTLNRGGG